MPVLSSEKFSKPVDPRYGRPFVARDSAVASPHQLATAVGNSILRRGGNAIDAMVAVNATLGVVFPHMTGPGGDAFWMIYDGATGERHVLNASGHTGSNASMACYKEKSQVDARGPRAAITVPGAVDGWLEAHSRFGRITFAECLQPAIDYARKGFPVNRLLAKYSDSFTKLLQDTPSTADVFLKDGKVPYQEGEILRNPDLAETLEAIVKGGRKTFYEGEIAQKITEYLQKHDGLLTQEDFSVYHAEWMKPISMQYRGKEVITQPPNSGGFVTLQILGMLDHVDVASLADDPAAYIDYVSRATAFALRDRDLYLNDPGFHQVPLDRLLSKEYLADRAKNLHSEEVTPPEKFPSAKGDTTFSCAVDDEGNIAALTQSLYWEWGSGVVAEGTGMLLQNRGSFFSLDSNDWNCLEPRKRPGHTLTNSIVFGEEGPELVMGTMGGDGQPQTQAALATRIFDFGYNVQSAIDAPRWLLGRTWGERHRGLRLEGRFGNDLVEQLNARGHENVSLVEDFSDVMGHAQAIQIFRDHLEVGADPRADGTALGI